MIRLTSPEHWHARFDRAIDAMRTTPFAYGQSDCALGLVAPVVLALTGEDVATRFRGAYADRQAAIAVMQAEGFANLADLVASILPEIPEGQARARIGDVAAIPDVGPFGFALGVFNGERCFVLTPKGLGTVDRLQATRAFFVG